MARKSLAVRPAAQPAAVNHSLQQVAHQEEGCCHQCQARGSQDTAALPTGNTHYSVPEKIFQRHGELKFLCLWGALLNWLSRAARVFCNSSPTSALPLF